MGRTEQLQQRLEEDGYVWIRGLHDRSKVPAGDDQYYPIHCGEYEPFLIYARMRGLEQAYENLALSPDIADAILGRLFDFHYEWRRRMFEAAGKGRIDLCCVAEDLGSQSGPLKNLEMYRRFLMPNQIKIADLIRSYGVHGVTFRVVSFIITRADRRRGQAVATRRWRR